MNARQTFSDVDLVALCASGDASAWSEFVERFNRRIVGYVIKERRARGGTAAAWDAEDVSDLTQEVYVRLLANDRRVLRAFRGDSEFAVLTYLARVARAVVSDDVRRENSKKRAARLVPLDAALDGDPRSLAETLEADFRGAPDYLLAERRLPGRLRDLLTIGGSSNAARDTMVYQLHVFEGLSAREIAAIPSVHMSVPAVVTTIRRTRDRLKASLGETCDLSV